MTAGNPVAIQAAVEGLLDEAVIKRLIEEVGAIPGSVYGKYGKSYLRERMAGYNAAARFSPWAVLVDLNHEHDCAPPLRAAWLPHSESQMCFRVAVREVEAWLLADREGLARFLSVAVSRVPPNPEALDDPKGFMIGLARRSRRREIREEMVPRPGSERAEGPAYTSRLIQFVTDRAVGWRPDAAASLSPSLYRCLRCMRQLVAGAGQAA